MRQELPVSEASLEKAMKDYDRVIELDQANGAVHYFKALVWSARAREAKGDERNRFADEAIRELTVAIEQKGWKGDVSEQGLDAVKGDPRVWKLLHDR